MAANGDLCARAVLQSDDRDQCSHYQRFRLPCLRLLHAFGEFLEFNFKNIWNFMTFSQGGIKAVVWTDVIQILLMYGSLGFILLKGIGDVGGFSFLLDVNANSSRFEPPE